MVKNDHQTFIIISIWTLVNCNLTIFKIKKKIFRLVCEKSKSNIGNVDDLKWKTFQKLLSHPKDNDRCLNFIFKKCKVWQTVWKHQIKSLNYLIFYNKKERVVIIVMFYCNWIKNYIELHSKFKKKFSKTNEWTSNGLIRKLSNDSAQILFGHFG